MDEEVRDRVLHDLGVLMAGLAVPVSLELPLGTARDAWVSLHRVLAGFGWSKPEQYEARLREVLAGG